MVRTTLKAATLCMMLPAAAGAADSDWAKVADALGKPGTEMAGGVYRVGLPRRDRRKIGGRAAIATGGYGSWAGWNFCPKPDPSVPL